MKCHKCPYYEQKTSYGVELIKCNNKCRKAETMTREEAINHLKTVAKSAIDSGYDSAVVDAVSMATKALEQEPKIGTWRKDIDNSRRWDRVRFYCSECGSWQTYGETDYCPKCGARMIKPQESEGENDN